MQQRSILVLASLFTSVITSSLALGAETTAELGTAANAGTTAQASGRASGFLVQSRLQTQASVLSLIGAPGFLLGYQGSSFAVGLGASLSRFGFSTRTEGAPDDDTATIVLYQVVPTVLFDVWQSADGRARANFIAGVGYGQGSMDITSQNRSCQTDAMGNQLCTYNPSENSIKATMIPLMLGFGGDYFLSRNFALGGEAGLQATIVTSVDLSNDDDSSSLDSSANMQVAYGALRATLVLGD